MSAADAAADTTARFAGLQRPLALFAEGLSGRHLHLKPRETPDSGARAHRMRAEPDSLLLPGEIGFFASARENAGAYRIAVLHQLGYFDEGTFAFDLGAAASAADPRLRAAAEETLARDAAARVPRRMPAAARVPDLERFLAAAPRPRLLRRVFFTLEDLRIDRALAARYPGARADLERVLGHALACRPPLASRRGLALAVELLVRFSLGADAAQLRTHGPGDIAARVLDAASAVLQPAAGVYVSAAAALEVCVLLEPLFRRARRAGIVAQAAAGDGPPGEGARSSEESGGPAPAGAEEAEAADEDFEVPGVEFRGELRSVPMLRHAHGGGPGGMALAAGDPGGALAPQGDAGPAGEAVQAVPRARTGGLRRPVQREARSFLYDEWDCHSKTYLRSWCRVHEQRLRGEDFEFIDALRRRTAELAGEVRRGFSRIRPESWLRVHRASDGDELELDALIDAVIDRRSGRDGGHGGGHSSDENLYLRRDRGLREVAAAFLVDMSASTDFPIPDPAVVPAAPQVENDPYLWGRYSTPPDLTPSAPRRRVIDVARESLALMCDALHRLGDSHAVYGFSGSGRENVEFNIIKDFDEPLSARSWAALAAMEPRRSTRMGPAIRHAAAKLARQPLRRRVLIIVSDGYPEDEDYGPDRRDREYGIQDTARALEEAARAGIATFCITIDPAGNDYLRRMCEADRYLVIDDVAALPEELGKVYRALTRGSGPAARP